MDTYAVFPVDYISRERPKSAKSAKCSQKVNQIKESWLTLIAFENIAIKIIL